MSSFFNYFAEEAICIISTTVGGAAMHATIVKREKVDGVALAAGLASAAATYVVCTALKARFLGD